jgi:hypothetical protein
MITAKGLIRKISISDPKTGLTYIVGQPMRKDTMIVTEIRLDVEQSNFTGRTVYDVIVRTEGSPHSRIWKSIEGMPVVIEFDLDEERDVENK